MSKRPKNTINGWININKSLGVTSADVVNKAKWLLRPQKIGHAGTLDPLATGVLPLALGEGTKCVNLLMDARKTYEFSVTFGQRRSTDDAQGEVVATSAHMPTEAEIMAVLPQFTGAIMQLPPIYSALKVAGRRAYDLARAGEEVVLAPRPVTVHRLEVMRVEWLESSESLKLVTPGLPRGPFIEERWIPAQGRDDRLVDFLAIAHFRAVVSKGTYIRSLGRDIAQAVGSEGYISRLHRSAVGNFTDQDAISLDSLEESVHKAQQSGCENLWLKPLKWVLDDIPALEINGEQFALLRHGRQICLVDPHPDAAQMAVLYAGELVALVKAEGNRLIPIRLLMSGN